MNNWKKIAPFWSVKNLIAVNPLQGFEDLHFKDALKEAEIYFQQTDLPEGMCNVNRESIKWLQAFFNEGQATIKMPQKESFLKSILELLIFDDRVHGRSLKHIKWLKALPKEPTHIITKCLISLGIQEEKQELFTTLMLTTLPGWASYIKYLTEWNNSKDVTQNEYMALRLIITYLMWPEAAEILTWHKQATHSNSQKMYEKICKKEKAYQDKLFIKLETEEQQEKKEKKETSDAQFIFCIDVRSEPFRRKLEAAGNYETFGYAGFFGIPVTVKNYLTDDEHAACPVLLQPQETVKLYANKKTQRKYQFFKTVQKMFVSIKSTFTVPLTFVEAVGILSGIAIFIKTFLLRATRVFKLEPYKTEPSIDTLPLEKQVIYAHQGLTMIGLTDNFAPLVVVCGHASTTTNNIYQSSLDCGACAGHSGVVNAQIFAAILNNKKVRKELDKKGISIPDTTTFVAAEHNTTTDELTLINAEIPELKKDLLKLKKRSGISKSKDWAETRPEWGLARNAAFIIGPREKTKNIDLEGRVFLHSYDYKKDPDKSSLRKILTAPVIVGQWINAQYLFSTLDNVAFGGGSKVTKNITGKIGIMQGNASDLMTGLSLQSVYKTDTQNYHEPLRLTVCVYAPQEYIDEIINTEPGLKKLVDNKWIFLKNVEFKKSAPEVKIRIYKESDLKSLVHIFYNTIHIINAQDYSKEQLNVWAPHDSIKNLKKWQQKWNINPPFVAEINNTLVGFAELEDNGHIDCFYVHHDFQGCGIGTILINTIEKEAKNKKLHKIYAEVSITAKPFFEKKGFKTIREQTVFKQNVKLTNFVMEKLINNE